MPDESIPIAPDPVPFTSTAAASDFTPASPVADPRWNTLLLLIAWLAIFAFAMSFALDHQFDRRHDWNTAIFATEARVLVHDGFVKMRGGTYVSAGNMPRELRDFYVGHPPLLTWMLAGWMKMFQMSNRVIRSLPLAFTLLNLLLLYVFVRSTIGALPALATTIFCSMFPMTGYFSQIVTFEPIAMTFMLAASLAYLRWIRARSAWAMILLLGFLALGCWTDWPVFIFAGVLAVVHLATERKTWPWKTSVAILAVPVIVFGLFCLWVHLNGGEMLGVVHRAELRTGLHGPVATANEVKIASSGYRELAGQIKSPGKLNNWFLKWLSIPALALAFVGAIGWRWISRDLAVAPAGRTGLLRLLLVFLITQMLYTLLFPEGAALHQFWQYYLIVPVSILAGGLCVWLTVRGRQRRTLFMGITDRLAWAIAALIPLMALGPMLYHLGLRQPADPPADARIADARPLQQATHDDDVIFTNNGNLGFALGWYSDRMIDFEHARLGSLVDIETQVKRYPGQRVIFLWDDNGSTDALSDLVKNYGMHAYKYGALRFYLLSGSPEASWEPDTPKPPLASISP